MREPEKVLVRYHAECEEISRQCVAEGYPSHGSNWELRCQQLWDEYYEAEYNYAIEQEGDE